MPPAPCRSLRLLLVEKEDDVARHQSGHNSGVIHSGIYYKPGSLKARFCVEGAAAMVEFCREHSLPHEVCGKVIVATSDDEVPRLKALLERGQANGLAGLRLLQPEELREIEPHCGGLMGMRVPSTGIADYAAVSRKYAEIIAAQGGTISTGTEVQRVVPRGRGNDGRNHARNLRRQIRDQLRRPAQRPGQPDGGPEPGSQDRALSRRILLPGSGENASGAHASSIPCPIPNFLFSACTSPAAFTAAWMRGPNAVLALKREGYKRTDFSLRDLAGTLTYPGFWHMAGKYWRDGAGEYYRSLSKRAFVKALQRLVPEIVSSDLVADGSGVRAHAVRRDGSFVDDFQFVHSPTGCCTCATSPRRRPPLPCPSDDISWRSRAKAWKAPEPNVVILSGAASSPRRSTLRSRRTPRAVTACASELRRRRCPHASPINVIS